MIAPGFRRRVIALLMAPMLMFGIVATSTAPAEAKASALTNTAHLDFLLDRVALSAIPGHTTYQLAKHPKVTMPWTYADSRPGGTFARVGGGPLDPATGWYGQGAFNADDISRAAVVYLRHWRQFGDRASKKKAYELLRGLTYLQTTTGKHRGNVVLWIQSDGTLNPSPMPVELPDPSDSGPSYWTARTIWALGEGYAAFAATDPAFARFLDARLKLSVDAVQREVLVRYGQHQVADGRRVPSWLIVNGADATAEATLGLSAYLEVNPRNAELRRVLRQLLEGVAEMGTSTRSWPYGAILPWAESRSMWHAWSSQMAGALARGSVVLDRPQLLRPAVREATSFDPLVIASGGPDNGWYPTPVDQTQIAYGIDSRVQNLLATADAGQLPGLRSLAAMNASWFFGANRSGEPLYDPATGVTFDGLQSDGTINRNSGAESTIHGLLTMLALDAHPAVAKAAKGWRTAPQRAGLEAVEAETATTTSGTVVTSESAWTGESQYGNGSFLRLERGQRAQIDLGPSDQRRIIEPVAWQPERGRAVSRWTLNRRSVSLRHRVGDQGITAVPGALLPQRLRCRTSRHPRECGTLPASRTSVTVAASRGQVEVDAVISRPMVSTARYDTSSGATWVLTSADRHSRRYTLPAGTRGSARSYDSRGRFVRERLVTGRGSVWLAPGGFAVVTAG